MAPLLDFLMEVFFPFPKDPPAEWLLARTFSASFNLALPWPFGLEKGRCEHLTHLVGTYSYCNENIPTIWFKDAIHLGYHQALQIKDNHRE